MIIDVGFYSDAWSHNSFTDVTHQNAAPYVDFTTSSTLT